MTDTNHLDLMLEALTEVVREEKEKEAAPFSATKPPQTPPAPALPNLGMVLARISPLPSGALFLGMANDGLPVLLDLYDPVPGPILIAGDASSGKTRLLQTIARAVDHLHAPDAAQYGIVTANPDEWKTFYGNGNNAGIYHAKEENTPELIQSLVTWAHNNKGDGQTIILFIDGLDVVTALDDQTKQNLRWLLLRGPNRRVWTFASLNANRANEMTEWLDFFRTRLFGCVVDTESAMLLTGNSTLNHLAAGDEFAMREGDQLLKFWLPSID
jgi:hypothetical protein